MKLFELNVFLCFLCSSLFGREKYFGFAVDWFIVLISISSCLIVFTAVASLYVGLCLYISGMVTDMRTQLISSTFVLDGNVHQTNQRRIYAEEIAFHIEIIEYDFATADTAR